MADSEPEVPLIDDAAEEQLRRLLTDLADDPDAPESSVSGLSVIAAARATAGSAGQRGATVGSGKERTPDDSGAVGELHVLAARADAARGRQQRRRTGLIAVLVAASLAGLAAIVIPVSLNSGSTTATSAESAVAGSLSGTVAGSAAAAAGTAAAEPGEAAQDAGPGRDAADSGEAGAAAPERPAPGPDALTALIPADGVTPPEQAPEGADLAAESCWPALSSDAAAALTGSLPAGAFGPPTTLTATCGPDPVGGAALVGTTPGTAVVVRVSTAAEGACALGNSEAGVRCAPRGGGVYIATDSAGGAVAFAYGNGNEVVVSAPPAEPGAISAPPVSGLSADQLVAAAQAVLGSLG